MSGTNMPDGFKRVKASKTKPSEGSALIYRHTWEYDFTGCTLEQVADLAVESMVIRNQGLIRSDAKKGQPIRFPEGLVKVKVADVIAGRTQPAAPPTFESILALAKADPEFAKRLVGALERSEPAPAPEEPSGE